MDQVQDVLISLSKTTAGWSLSMQVRGPAAKGFTQGSRRYRGLTMPEAVDVVGVLLDELDPAQQELFRSDR